MSQARSGVVFGATAYVLWGMSALYWPLMHPTGALEILALRILWSPLAIIALLTVLRRWQRMRDLLRRPRQLALLVAAGALTSVNWGLFIYATTHHRVVDASLGYFITPLVSVAFGVLVFRERLRATQWAAVGIGAVTVIVLTANFRQAPWIAIGLAATFGTYGLIKKYVDAGTIEGLMVETAALFPFALVYCVVIQASGTATFGHVSLANTTLGIGSGIVMMTPMLLFGATAKRIPLNLMGMLQFIEPIVQFSIGFLIFGEPMPAIRWAGFVLVWVALALLTVDGVRSRANRLRERRRVLDPVPEGRLRRLP